jgi:hypothetical protein
MGDFGGKNNPSLIAENQSTVARLQDWAKQSESISSPIRSNFTHVGRGVANPTWVGLPYGVNPLKLVCTPSLNAVSHTLRTPTYSDFSKMSPQTCGFWLSIPGPCEDLDTGFFKTIMESEISTTRQVTPLPTGPSLIGGLASRARVTAGVCLPSDTPLHIICGSKDVIHSWAIPGLSVKIDCIPGYNCHRRLILRWRGLFWGQCMEVCGRYHHWMPLLVRVAHVDVFIAWVSAFSH